MRGMNRAALIASGVALLFAGAGTYFYISLSSELANTRSELLSTQARAIENEAALAEDLRRKTEENIELAGALRLHEEENDAEKRTVRKLSNTVEDLEKIVATDPELLAKYSKVYFLNENYAPAKLAPVDERFAFEEGRVYEVHAEMKPFLEAQMKMQKEQELTQLITQMMKQMHEMAMSVIRNIGG